MATSAKTTAPTGRIANITSARLVLDLGVPAKPGKTLNRVPRFLRLGTKKDEEKQVKNRDPWVRVLDAEAYARLKVHPAILKRIEDGHIKLVAVAA